MGLLSGLKGRATRKRATKMRKHMKSGGYKGGSGAITIGYKKKHGKTRRVVRF